MTFDLTATDGSVRKKEAVNPVEKQTPKPAPPKPANSLDSEQVIMTWRKVMALWARELDRQAEPRMEQATDADFYDSIQWSDEDIATLKARNQMPLVFNVIATTIDWVLGTEKRSRTDYKILPRRKEDSKPAQKKSELMKYLEDVNKSQFEVSSAFEDAAKVGIGWIEDGWQDDSEGEPLYTRYESWRCMLYDSRAQRKDLEDARFIGRKKWLDVDIVKAMFPKRTELIDRSVKDPTSLTALDALSDLPMDAQESSHMFNSNITGAAGQYARNRVPVYEVWFKVPTKTVRLRGGNFSGELYDPNSNGHQEALDSGDAERVEKVSLRVHVIIFTEDGVLWLSESPYRHNRYPFTPIFAKRRDRDLMPYGIIRNIRDIQIDINKRASKALHIISTNKVIMEDGAVEDINEFADEVAKPDAIIVKKKGTELQINADRELSQYHLEMMSRNIAMVQQVGGITDENLGRQTNASSGVAIQARQNQGQLATAGIFDNLYYARQCHGEKQLSLIEQFMSQKKQFRITNQRGAPDYITINDDLPDNDVTRTKADFIISEEDWRATMRQAQVDTLLDMLGKLAPVAPQLLTQTLDIIVDMMDIPMREEIVKRIRQVTGMRDPDAEGPTQEDIAAQQAKNAQAALTQQLTELQMAKLKADADKTAAQAETEKAKVAKINMETQSGAITSSQAIATTPQVADIADHLLHEAGYISRTEKEQALAAIAQKLAEFQAAQRQNAQQQPPQMQQQPGQPIPQQGGTPMTAQPQPPQGA